MPNCIVSRNNIVGFGISEEDAEYDWYVHQCIREDGACERFSDRKRELSPWMPMDNLLHISGTGCLKYEYPWLYETKSGRQMLVNRYGFNIYYYMACLFEGSLTYTDICICMKDELSMFFSGISQAFAPLYAYPDILCIDKDNGFRPQVYYNLRDGIVIGVDGYRVGLKYSDSDKYYAVSCKEDVVAAVYYLAYRAGFVFSETGDILYGKENRTVQ